jgi:hypothetical protein
MSGRRIRRLVLLVLAAGIGYWIYKDRPTVGGLIDSITNPLMGSKAAVQSSERNRVVGDASSAITDQTDTVVRALREGMTTYEVRDTMGNPDRVEQEKVDGVLQSRWTYARAKRVLVIRDGRVASIGVID